jgi:hypothetical protein
MARRRKRRRSVPPTLRTARPAPEPTPKPLDRRSISAEIREFDGVPVAEAHVIVVVEPIRLDSGYDLYFQSPFVVPFYLLKSKALRDAAEPKRLAALANTVEAQDGALRPVEPGTVHDALEDLVPAVVLAAAAIEAHANDMIRRLPDDAMVEVPTRIAGETVAVMRNKTGMDRLPLGDKLSRVCPLLYGAQSIKGSVAWQKYKRLSRLRNALVHPRPVAINDPLNPGPFGRLMLGDGSTAPEDAAAVIEAIDPQYLPEAIRSDFGL